MTSPADVVEEGAPETAADRAAHADGQSPASASAILSRWGVQEDGHTCS
jgi:hypothetical protein